MQCEKCGRECAQGCTYSFRYGTKGPSTTYHDFSQMKRITTTPYTIAGTIDAWICDRCVLSARLVFLIPAFALLLFAGVGTFYEIVVKAAPLPDDFGGIAVVYAGMLLAFFAYAALAKREFGERVAIRTKKKDLRARQYNAFLTTSAYKRINKS